MRRGQVLLMSIVSVLLVQAAGWGQQRPNGLFLTSPLSLSSGYDDNFVANSRVLDDTVAILTSPTFSWIKSTHRSSFAVDYEAEAALFSRYQDLNSLNHSATLRYSYRFNSRLSADVGDYFLSTTDASRKLAESQLLLPYGRFQQNSFFAGLKYRLNYRTVLFFRFDNAVLSSALSGLQANAFDQMTNAGKVTLDHTVNRRHSVTASYAYLHVRPLNSVGLTGYSYQAVNSLNAGYLYALNPGLIFRVTGGVVRGREFAYTGGGAVEKQLGGLWMMAGYQRYLTFLGGFSPSGGATGETSSFANGLMPNSLFQAVTVRVRGQLTRRVGLEFNGQRGRTSIGERGVRSLIAQSRLDYKLSERFIVFARAEYYGQNVGQFSESPLSRRRYFGGLEIVLSRPPETEGASRRGKLPAEPAKPQEAELQASEER